ncbi:MAG: polysaccharide deacetylase family protein [Clostridiales bacterium]|nr:polysaccharide deacetylase family protein [Clostridiales bacterium]
MIIVIKKCRFIIAVVLIIAIIACIVVALTAKNSQEASAKPAKLLPIYSVDCQENYVALSFDAAWGSDKTMQILEILDTYDVKATFFLVGFWVDKYPEMVKEIHKRGHLIGNHSNTHAHFNSLSYDQMLLEIETTAKKIKDITGEDVTYFRAPFGEYNNKQIALLNEKGIKGIQWDVDSLDWKGISGKQITANILSKVKKGSIILCHNNSDHILDALPLVLLGLQNKKLTSIRMDELVIQNDYYIDNNGVQRPNAK